MVCAGNDGEVDMTDAVAGGCDPREFLPNLENPFLAYARLKSDRCIDDCVDKDSRLEGRERFRFFAWLSPANRW